MAIGRDLNALWLAALLAGCATLGPATVTDPPRLPAEARDPEFRLVISSPRERWAVNEPIEASATLSYLGPQARTTIGGAGAGPIAFSLHELGGTRRMEGIMTSDCAPHDIGPHQSIVMRYMKSGAIDPGEPNEAFYQAFFADPEFRLPAGRWQIEAWAAFNDAADCSGRQVEMRAAMILVVE